MQELLNRFDETGLDPKNTVVRCETQDEVNLFLDYLCCKGIWTEPQISYLKQHCFDKEGLICYHISRQSWCNDRWYKIHRPEYSIVDFCDVYQYPNTDDTPVAAHISISYDDIMVL